MKKLLLVLCAPCVLSAWGELGHKVVANIAETGLTAKAKERIAAMLQGQPMASVASWPDQIRRERPETERWHFTDIPRKEISYDPARDCAITRYGDCVVLAVEQFRQILADPKTRDARRLEALKFIIHFIGDLHQPLHTTSDNDDAGGNAVKIEFLGKAGNLHGLWDYGLIESMGVSETDLTQRLLGTLTDDKRTEFASGNLVDWVLEAHLIADINVYDIPADHKIGDVYRTRSLPVIDLQLQRAGVRLAKVLNEALQ